MNGAGVGDDVVGRSAVAVLEESWLGGGTVGMLAIAMSMSGVPIESGLYRSWFVTTAIVKPYAGR